MKKGVGIIVFLVLLLVVTIIFLFNKNSSYVEIKGKKIKVEIADTELERDKGLMYRESLGENSGMLFVYPDSEIRSFWMKNTMIPLDIIYINENLEIIDIKNALPCSNEPCIIYTSASPAKYVLEVNYGYAQESNISIGEKISLSV